MLNAIINNIKISVEPNTTVLQACQHLNIELPKFCFQDNLEIAGNCRMCLVEVKNSPKPVVSCAMPVVNGMEIYTDTPLIRKARESVLEFLLINHPLDCPICDQGGECDLQDEALNFGTDRSRFIQVKHTVEDKNCGPFIKTIMTRCIHCTKCVRFSNDVCDVDHLGTTGRGNHTEIGFYVQKMFRSEFSGNVIDLCPVGALTSKVYAFKARPWELKRFESIDIFDAIGSNIKVNTLKNKIVRVLPRGNSQVNIDWIPNKIRFFFDAIQYQRIETPLLKINGKFQKINWSDAFEILNKKCSNIDGSKMNMIVGNLTELESIQMLKQNMNLLGTSNIQYSSLKKNNKRISSDITSNFLFNEKLQSIKESDVCLLIDCNPRTEGSILNIHLKNRVKKGNFEIASIGSKVDLTYPVENLGLSLNVLISILEGKHSFCKKLKNAKNPLIICGTNLLNKKEGKSLIKEIQKLSILKKKNWNGFNLLENETSSINFSEIFNNIQSKKNSSFKLNYLFNTENEMNSISLKGSFNIYQGHHFTEDAQKANLILPGVTFFEKNGIFINTEGRIQKVNKVIKMNKEERNDFDILRGFSIFLNQKNSSTFKYNSTNYNIYSVLPYLKENFLLNKIIDKSKNINKNSFFLNKNSIIQPLIMNTYLVNTLEKSSKVLTTSYNKLLNKSNF